MLVLTYLLMLMKNLPSERDRKRRDGGDGGGERERSPDGVLSVLSDFNNTNSGKVSLN